MAEAPAPADDEKSEATPEPAAKKPKKKLIIIVAAAVLALGGAGAGAYFMFGHSGDEEAAEVADAKDAKADAKAKGKEKSKEKSKAKDSKPKGPAIYAKFDPPFVVNFQAGENMRFLQVSIEVMTRDPHTAELIKQNDPMIRNDLLMLLGSQTQETIGTREGKDQLRAQALKTVAKVVGSEGGEAKSVEQLYFTSFVMQ
jgi:flagellar protein FliL